DQNLKTHPHPIPRIGGVPIAIAYLGSFALLLLLSLRGGDLVRGNLGFVWKLFPAAALIFATGLLDDLIGLKPWQKLLGQLAAAFLTFDAGVRFTGIGSYQFPLLR